MSIATDLVTVVPGVSHRPWWRGRIVQVSVVVAAMVLVYRAFGGDHPWPDSLVWNGLSARLDAFQSWLLDQRSADPESLFFRIFNGFATFVDNLVSWFERAILWLSWLGAAAVGTVVTLRFGGVRAAVIVGSAFASFALLGLWEAKHADTRPHARRGRPVAPRRGAARHRGRALDRFQAAISPVLDAMQIIPAFAYLMPVVILFSIGPAAAVVSTMVYAVPPAGGENLALHAIFLGEAEALSGVTALADLGPPPLLSRYHCTVFCRPLAKFSFGRQPSRVILRMSMA